MKILIADDEEDARLYLEITLKSQGYDILSAINGQEALDLARREHPDLIISDALMPVMDGFELCRQVKSDSKLKQIPFIFLTGTYDDSRDQDLAVALGAVRYLLKPVAPEPLIKLVREVFAELQESSLVPETNEHAQLKVVEQHRDVVSRKLDQKLAELNDNKR